MTKCLFMREPVRDKERIEHMLELKKYLQDLYLSMKS